MHLQEKKRAASASPEPSEEGAKPDKKKDKVGVGGRGEKE